MWKLKVATGDSPWLNSLCNFAGRQIWEYDPDEQLSESEVRTLDSYRSEFWENRHEKRHSADRLMRFQYDRSNPLPEMADSVRLKSGVTVQDEHVDVTLRRALRFYGTIQSEDGHWAGDYGGPMFLMPGLIITCYISGSLNVVLSKEDKEEMKRYLYNHQNEDGGWGLHIEGPSTMFGSVLSYVSLRILGEGPDGGPKGDPQAMWKGRSWILTHGTATYCTSWGKFWLAVLGVYEWDGHNPVPPEAWLLPYALPVHPGRFWCHCRMVYLPMCYLYGRRAVGPITDLVLELRKELYSVPYETINWSSCRNLCAKEDLFYPHPWIQDVIWWTLHHVVEPVFLHTSVGKAVRRKALEYVMEHVHYEDENTRYVDIGPVNKTLNMLCCWFEDPLSDAFKKHLPRLRDYLWVAEDGMKMQGYNGSQLWDTAFAVQAIFAADLMDESIPMLRKAHEYINACQVRADCPGDLKQYYRHISKGAWPFSTQDHGWPIADCSSEGLKAALLLAKLPSTDVGKAIEPERLYDCVNVILSYQNSNGGFATYELTRSYPWIEIINPAETFGDIVIDYQYVELTSACIQSLDEFSKDYPDHRSLEIRVAIQKAADWIKRAQRPDGSWYGSWGVCFTYGTWFGVWGLLHAAYTYDTSPEIRKACDFLLEKQMPGGGWGESYLSCQDGVYSPLPDNEAHIVQTAWALMTLIKAGQADRDVKPLHSAARVIINHQMEFGDFPQQQITGVFNKNCMISYSAYRNIFPIWALGLFRSEVLGTK
eukprot:TRINITY_DN22226_c0_g1_i1.p1 TRINITY_DN22226_c0_g1~~TRINITY_DN22226_c0_g1_i1.p1  ORF type:complete len:764 (-),score=100.86 TRINITY_DN22226_c0_g1_i1:719-3010(-)